jgi:hypothetical protein
MHGNRDAQFKPIRVLEEGMAAGGMVNKEAGSLESAENFFRSATRQVLAHARLGESNLDLLFNRIFVEFNVVRCRQAVLGQTL